MHERAGLRAIRGLPERAQPDKLALLERWSDQAALDTHAKLNSTRPGLRPELRSGVASAKTINTIDR